MLTETEKSIRKQPALLGSAWEAKLSKRAKAQIKGAKEIVFVGTGSSFHVALWAHWLARTSSCPVKTRATIGWDALVENEFSATRGKTEKSSLYVVISHRGYKNLTKQILDELRPQRRILICSENSFTGDHPFIYSSPQETSNAHTMSVVAAMGACSEIIAEFLAPKDQVRFRRWRAKAAMLLDELLVDKNLLLPPILPHSKSNLHIVGGGPLFPIALEFSLKAREIFYQPAHAYNTEEFLHGPLASVNAGDQVLFLRSQNLSSSKITKTLDFLFNDRRLRGINACKAIGAKPFEVTLLSKANRALNRSINSLPLSWQALLMLIVLQKYCLKEARKRKINPDLNRRDHLAYEKARVCIEHRSLTE